jgi:hypothetical protein
MDPRILSLELDADLQRSWNPGAEEGGGPALRAELGASPRDQLVVLEGGGATVRPDDLEADPVRAVGIHVPAEADRPLGAQDGEGKGDLEAGEDRATRDCSEYGASTPPTFSLRSGHRWSC